MIGLWVLFVLDTALVLLLIYMIKRQVRLTGDEGLWLVSPLIVSIPLTFAIAAAMKLLES